MANCLITSGITLDCNQLRRVGGVNPRVWAFNLEELQTDKYTESGGYVTAINFFSYAGLYPLEGKKKSHSAGYTFVSNDPGGPSYFQHDVVIKTVSDTPTKDAVIQDLAVGTFGFIVETANEEFLIYGPDNGLSMVEGSQNSGNDIATDTSDNLTFNGGEKNMPKRVSVGGTGGDYAATKAYLEGLQA